jgi:hypothetical protein
MLLRDFILILASAAWLLTQPVFAASVELNDGLKLLGRAAVTSDGKISIKVLDKDQRSFAWEQVRVVRFNQPGLDFNPLPRGWRAEDIGRVAGNSSDNKGVFAFSVNGADWKDKKYQPLHGAFRVVHGDPEVMARITGARGTSPTLGGVMLRENLDIAAGYALLGVTGDKRLRFEVREGGWNAVKPQDLGAVTLPIWLKLVRAEKEGALQAFRSTDGVKWTQVAHGKLNCHNAPYPESSDHWVPRVYAGLAITAPKAGEHAGFECDHATISCRAFLGEYFAENNFTKFAFARPDKKIEFWWGDRSPAPTLEPDKFSVRWRGQIEPKFSEPYRFYCDVGVRVLVNSNEITCARWEDARRAGGVADEVMLVAGRKYDVQIEFAKTGRDTRAARFGWSSRSQPREQISSSAVSYTFDANTPGEDFENVSNVFIPAGVWLRSGSLLVGDVTASDRSGTQIAFAGDKPMTVLNHRVARLVLRPVRQPVRFDLAANRTGMFLQNGDFMESELDQITEHTVVMESVLFGRRSYSRDNAQPLAIVLNDFASTNAPLTVKLVDGTTLKAQAVRGDRDAIVVQEPSLGELCVPAAQLQEIRNNKLGPAK